jgi:chemotaxis response regulator CheB
MSEIRKEIEEEIQEHFEEPSKQKTELDKLKDYVNNCKTYNDIIAFEVKLPLIRHNLTDEELVELNQQVRVFMMNNLTNFAATHLQYSMEKILNDIVNEYRKERAKAAKELGFKKKKFETVRSKFKKK